MFFMSIKELEFYPVVDASGAHVEGFQAWKGCSQVCTSERQCILKGEFERNWGWRQRDP